MLETRNRKFLFTGVMSESPDQVHQNSSRTFPQVSRQLVHLSLGNEARTAAHAPLGVVLGVPLVHVCRTEGQVQSREDRNHQNFYRPRYGHMLTTLSLSERLSNDQVNLLKTRSEQNRPQNPTMALRFPSYL